VLVRFAYLAVSPAFAACEHISPNEALMLAGTLTVVATVAAASIFGASPQRRTALAHRGPRLETFNF
jgi:hypothetical protein